MTYDGTDFLAIDEQGYAADRPMSTALDHATRNQLYYLGNFPDHCSYAERLDVDGVAARMYAGNPAANHTWIRWASRGCKGFGLKVAASGGPSAASTDEGEAWLSVVSAEAGGVVDGAKVSITNTTGRDDYRTYDLTVTFDEPLGSAQIVTVSLMYQSAAYNDASSSATLNPGDINAIQDSGGPFARNQAGSPRSSSSTGKSSRVDVIYDYDTSVSATPSQPGSPSPFARRSGYVVDLTWISTPSMELRELRDFDPYESEQIRAHDSIDGAKVLPTHRMGGGANFKASKRALDRYYTASVGVVYDDELNADWDEFPRWVYVGSSADVTKSVPVVIINDRVAISATCGVIGYREDEISQEPGLVVEDTESLTFQVQIDGTDTITQDVDVEFYRVQRTSNWPFFLQILMQRLYFTTSPDPRFSLREGQLFNIQGGVDERNLLTPVVIQGDLTGYTPGEVVQAQWTFPQTTDANNAYIVATDPVIQQYVTRAT